MSNIDIIVPVYNNERYLEKCIDSIINQTYKDLCLILIDDGSTDSSATICDYYSKKDRRIKTVHKKNSGVFQARMTGIKLANSDYIMFVDSDDWIDSRYVEAMFEKVELDTDVVISGISRDYGYRTEWVEQQIDDGIYYINEIRDKIHPFYINNGKFQSRGICPGLVAKIYRREYFERFLYLAIDIKYGEDFNLVVPIIYNAAKIGVVLDANCIYHYRMTQQSLTNSYCKNMYGQIKELYVLLFDYFFNDISILQQLHCDYVAAIVQCYKNECKYNQSGRIRKYNIGILENDEKFKNSLKLVDYSNYPFMEKIIINRLKKNRNINILIDAFNYILFFLYLRISRLVNSRKRK